MTAERTDDKMKSDHERLFGLLRNEWATQQPGWWR